MTRFITGAAVAAAVLLLCPTAPAVAGGGPEIERGRTTDRYQDDFILDLCGIDTWTTVTERWRSTTYPDGSETFHVVRTFVPDDHRIPVEKGAATSFFAPDGSRTTVGTPIHLLHQDGGTILIDAGRALFDAQGNLVAVDGPHPALGAELAELYCPDL